MAVVAYLNSFPASNGVEILKTHGAHELLHIDGSQPLDACFAELARANVYQCVGARDEVPQGLRVDAAFIDKAPNLLLCSASGSGVDVFDRQACSDAGVLIVNQAGANAPSVAEHAIAMMILLGKHMGVADRALRAGWSGKRSEFFGHDLGGRQVGVVGFGNIGRRVTQLLRNGFECNVLVCDPYVDDATISAGGARKVELPELLAESEIVTVHTPLNDETRGMFGAAEYAQMKEGALFVITARGEIHDEAALADALTNGHLAGAGLDVWREEPPLPTHPLVGMENVISTPHVAGGTYSSLENMARFAATQIIGVLDGKPPLRPVNVEALPRFEERRRELLNV